MGLFSIKKPSNKSSVNLVRKMLGMSQDEFDKLVTRDEEGAYYFKSTTLVMGADVTSSHYHVKEGTDVVFLSAFWGSEIERVTFPDSIKTIQKRAFDGCKKLTEINIPTKVCEINEFTFYNCESLRTVILPSSCASIGEHAFDGCKQLERLYLNNETTGELAPNIEAKMVGEYAFNDCISLKEVELPEGIVSLGESAFKDCESLINIKLPSTLELIQKNAFWNCSSLSELDVPASVQEINMSAMPSGLRTIRFRARTMKIARWAFVKCDKIDTVIVPKGCIEGYKKILESTTGINVKLMKNQLLIKEE